MFTRNALYVQIPTEKARVALMKIVPDVVVADGWAVLPEAPGDRWDHGTRLANVLGAHAIVVDFHSVLKVRHPSFDDFLDLAEAIAGIRSGVALTVRLPEPMVNALSALAAEHGEVA